MTPSKSPITKMHANRNHLEWFLVGLSATLTGFGMYFAEIGEYLLATLVVAIIAKAFFAYIRMPEAFFRPELKKTREELMEAYFRHRDEVYLARPWLKWTEDFCTYYIVFATVLSVSRFFL